MKPRFHTEEQLGIRGITEAANAGSTQCGELQQPSFAP
jgi:hypothetical protein